MHQVYPEDYSCIIPPQQDRGGLFIGNLEAAQNKHTLHKHGIRGILTCAKGVSLSHSPQQIPHTMQINANDHESYDISVHFDEAADFIELTLKKTNLMVHCLAGVSRSVSLVLGWLIKYRGMSYNQAYQLVKSRRRIVHPNEGFVQHLKRYEQKQREARGSASPIHSRSPSPTFNKTVSHFQSSQIDYKARTPSPTLKYRAEDMYQDLNPHQSHLLQRGADIYGYIKYQPQYYSPKKRRTTDYAYDKMNNISGQQASPTGENYRNASATRMSQKYDRVHIDTSQIDRKISQIRKKYQEYSNQPNYSRYHLEQPRHYSRNTIQKAEDLKNRSFNYIKQYERTTTRKANYIYSNY